MLDWFSSLSDLVSWKKKSLGVKMSDQILNELFSHWTLYGLDETFIMIFETTVLIKTLF